VNCTIRVGIYLDSLPPSDVMHTVELDEELIERIESHLEDDESVAEFIEELVTIYEHEGRFLQEEP